MIEDLDHVSLVMGCHSPEASNGTWLGLQSLTLCIFGPPLAKCPSETFAAVSGSFLDIADAPGDLQSALKLVQFLFHGFTLKTVFFL